jgi:hypothetical protein
MTTEASAPPSTNRLDRLRTIGLLALAGATLAVAFGFADRTVGEAVAVVFTTWGCATFLLPGAPSMFERLLRISRDPERTWAFKLACWGLVGVWQAGLTLMAVAAWRDFLAR